MRKILFFSSILFAGALQALATFNPKAPSMIQEGLFFSSSCPISLRAGYEGSFVFDRRMKMENVGDRRIDDFKMDSHLGLVVVNLWNRLDLFGGAGQTRVRSGWRVEFPPSFFSRIDLETHYGLTWSAGGNLICYEWKDLSASVGGRYEKGKSSLLWITSDGTPFAVAKENNVDWNEWQANLSLSYKIDFLVPYAGVKYSRAKTKVEAFDGVMTPIADNGGNVLSMESRKNWGMVLGCGISNSKYFQLNVEARLFDEEGGAVYGDFRF